MPPKYIFERYIHEKFGVIFTYAPTAHKAYAIVRPTLLSTPETLGNGTRTAAYNVNTDRPYLLFTVVSVY